MSTTCHANLHTDLTYLSRLPSSLRSRFIDTLCINRRSNGVIITCSLPISVCNDARSIVNLDLVKAHHSTSPFPSHKYNLNSLRPHPIATKLNSQPCFVLHSSRALARLPHPASSHPPFALWPEETQDLALQGQVASVAGEFLCTFKALHQLIALIGTRLPSVKLQQKSYTSDRKRKRSKRYHPHFVDKHLHMLGS